ncbi:DinB family protein [Pseudonocardia sp. HH130630-07]|uniref:DinB family protein n=1 Tax=Pseudonocardia sp. HH130630-07 TaxID=1690815 RepID=UPI000815336E|nr:DinB family protein [Pseudonocardia sp. HH130630-07]ANY06059.1 damage-inducible protein DinB [Pseudonocardia sp. HH130630-07]
MTDPVREQFDLTWSLAEYHLDRLTDDDLTWVPAPLHWTVHEGPDGLLRPDLSTDLAEPDPVPAPTVAWIAWHLLWWWGTALDELTGVPRRERDDVVCPRTADGVGAALRALAAAWSDALDGAAGPRRDEPVGFPWPEGRTVAALVAWAHAELMKNVAELGQLRLLRAAGASGHGTVSR